jgi:hypothetical protein
MDLQATAVAAEAVRATLETSAVVAGPLAATESVVISNLVTGKE